MGGQIEKYIFPGSGGALSDGLQKEFRKFTYLLIYVMTSIKIYLVLIS